LCGSLCDTVTGQIDGQQTLEQLQHANLFVVPLDSERGWYRYHHLFRDLLRKQLQHEAPESVPELHRRASQRCEEHGLIDEAIDHAFSAHDESRAGQLLADHAEAFFLRGEHVTLLQWIAALPDGQRKMRPALGIFQAIMLSAAGRNQEAALILQEVDQALSDSSGRTTWDRRLIGQAAAAHALIASLQDGPETILFHARRALDLSPAEAAWRSSVLLSRGNAYFLLGDLAACIQDLSEAIDRAKSLNIPILVLTAMPKLAQTYWMQGRLNQAAQICQGGFQYVDQEGWAGSPTSDSLFITWGAILCERNDLNRAAEFILRGLELSRSGHVILNQLFACRSMIRVRMAQRNLPAAEEFLRQAEALIQAYNIPFQHKSQIIGLKAQLWIQQGRLGEAEYVLQALDAQSDGEIPFTQHGRLYLSQAQLHLARGNLPAAEKTLDRLLRFSQSSGQQRWVIPLHILRSILQLARQDLPQALNALEVALELAEPEGFIQDFLDEGEPVIQLLHEAVRRKVRPEFAQLLLGRFSLGCSAEKPIGLVEPLSERELEVLKLVAEGLSNQEIASRLYLSLRTIKFHAGNIYGKLSVKSRTEAVSKARAIGLLPT
jgi:LuxR family maltose regulon positive regulatory protein